MAEDQGALFKYWAFISYSHRDEQWSRWLHEGIETYPVPRSLVGKDLHGRPVPRRLFPVFRDRDELPGAAELGAKIQQALTESLYLIVICSPHAAVSRWVDGEVAAFKALGRHDRVLCLIVDGEPNANPKLGQLECFPPAVRFKVDRQGQLTTEPSEPVGADARPGKDGKHNARLKLLAGMLGVGFDQLHQRERQRAVRRRIRYTLGALLLSALLVVGYIALADVGLAVPGGNAIRRSIDEVNGSVFRRVADDRTVREAAHQTRGLASGVLFGVWQKGGFFTESPKRAGHTRTLQVWDHAQALSGLVRSPDLSQEEKQELVKELKVLLDRDLFVEAGGKKYGYFAAGSLYTEAEPALWASTAIALAMQTGLLANEERPQFEQLLGDIQNHLAIYYDPASGGWNTFPNQFKPEAHTTYTAALALLTLVELHHANLPWHGEIGVRNEMLQKTAGWLIGQWDALSDTPGWRGAADDQAPVSDGLTLQIYSELLRAEQTAGVVIPTRVLNAIPLHLLHLQGRPLDFPSSVGRFSRLFTNHAGQEFEINPSVNYLWHPWGVDCVRLWLSRMDKYGSHPAERTEMRRVLGYLVVDVGKQFEEKVRTNSVPPFMAGETMYVYSRIPR